MEDWPQCSYMDLESHNGVAWVGLSVQLGHAPGPQHHQGQVEKVAEEATLEYSCDLCERSFATSRGLKQHQGRKHKAPTPSSIPEMDGADDLMIDYNLICKICEDCHEETKQVMI